MHEVRDMEKQARAKRATGALPRGKSGMEKDARGRYVPVSARGGESSRATTSEGVGAWERFKEWFDS